ncbi:MAG: type II toxin-antitoxin system VapC family toxin [Rudaea sp.]|uniref:type II toxin-antitoxin system VapC family toxin n=1 Tax=Rudaea sp. TaxID=2136325 RepID=UPI0039E50806
MIRGYLLDTCVISEATRPRASTKVRAWIRATAPESLFLGVATLAEIEQGIAALDDAGKARKLSAWLRDEVLPDFDGRILDVDPAVAARWGRLLGEGKRVGQPRPLMDALLAATAIEHGLSFVTRNVADFSRFDLDIVNPWQ